MYSNIFVDYRKSEINLWEYEDGHKVHKRLPAPLFFFLKDKLLKNPEYKTIFGDPARKIETDTIYAYKKKIERLKASGMELFESDIPLETKFIVSHYLGQELTIPDFDIWLLDIEVHSEKGFPKPEDANFPITIITVWSTKQQKYFIFAERDFNTSFLDEANEKYEKTIISNENELLNQFMTFVRNSHPDFLSGWNSNFFDIPYIVNRINKIFHEDAASDLSPIGVVKEIETTLKNGKIKKTYSIAGISCIDMLEVFKTYTFSARPSWKLDSIAEEELGERKLEYTGTLVDLYNNDWQKYVEYNVHDVRLLKKLEAKKKFLNILFSFCYGCRVPFEFYQKTVRVLDGAFLSELSKKNIVLPDVKRDIEPKKFPGGYVKDPIKGLHEWTVSFDATSLYPSIMMGWNISPETKIGRVDSQYVPDLRKLISGKDIDDYLVTFSGIETSIRELAKLIKEKNFCLAGNGTIYRQDVKGIVPSFISEWFGKRKYYKELMLEAERNNNKAEYSAHDARQINYKLLLNSVYGFLSTPYSRFYDLDNAMAVTLTGQSITKTVNDTVQNYFLTKFKDTELAKRHNAINVNDVCIYADTDSVAKSMVINDLGKNRNITIEDIFSELKTEEPINFKKNYDGREFVFPNNLLLPMFDSTISNVISGKVKYIEKHLTKKKLYKIKTKSGKTITVTSDHPLITVDTNSNMVNKELHNLKIGDKIIVI